MGYNYNTAQKMPLWLNERAGRLAGRPEGGAVMATTVLGIGRWQPVWLSSFIGYFRLSPAFGI